MAGGGIQSGRIIGATNTKPQLRLSAQNAKSDSMSERQMAKLSSATSAP